MSMLDIAVDSWGQTIEVSLTQNAATFDASSFTDILFKFKPPGLDVLSKVAAFKTDGSDGVCKYVVPEDMLSVAGDWVLWVVISKDNDSASIPSAETIFPVAHTY